MSSDQAKMQQMGGVGNKGGVSDSPRDDNPAALFPWKPWPVKAVGGLVEYAPSSVGTPPGLWPGDGNSIGEHYV